MSWDRFFDSSYLFYHKFWRQSFWIGETHPCFIQNFKSLKNRARCLKIFRLACFMLTYSKALATFCSSFILQSLIFIRVFSNTFVVDCVVFSSAVMTFYVLQAGDIENWLSMFLEKPTWFFFSNLTLVFWKHWH